ncbi:unnamed protein product, partial [Closterium sp. NIES-54]
VLSSLPSPGPPPFLRPPPVRFQSQLQPASPLPSPYSGRTGGLTERREPESRPVSPASRAASPVRTIRSGRVSRPRLPPVPGTHSMTLRPSTAPQRVPLPSPPASSLPASPDPESDSLRAASPAVPRFLAKLQKRHTCTDLAPPSDESVEPCGPYPELVGCLITSGMWLVLGGRARVVLTGHADASWVDDLATQRSLQGYTFSLGSGSFSWRSTRSSSVLSSSCEVEIYAGAMAAQELRWLIYLLADLGEAPRSPPVLYVDNKAMLALCQEHRLEHRTKHISLRYFLAQELQQRGQLRLTYVASQANTADVFTKALQPCDHQRFCTVLGLKSTPGRLHARFAHVGVETIKSSAKHDVATGLNIKPSSGADPPCVSCVGGKLARHTFPDKDLDAEEALAVVHIDLCRPFRVAAKDGRLYFLLLKDRHTRFVWVMPVAKKSDVVREFQKAVLMLRSDRGGEFLGKEFTNFVDSKGIVHNLTCPYTPQQNGMAEREMRTAVESVRTMLLHMGVQHFWWHLALRQAVWVRNCLERSTTPAGTTPYQLMTGKKPDLTLARVWSCMVQFMVPEQQSGGKLAPKARWGLYLGVSPESKGWEVLDLSNNKVVTSVNVIFYESLSLEDGKPSTIGEQQTGEPVEQEAAAGVQSTRELSKSAGGEQLVEGSKQLVNDLAVDKEGEVSAGEESTDIDVVEVPITKPELRRTGRARRPPERLSFHACLPPAAFTIVYDKVDDDLLYDDAEEDEELPELDPNVHADPEHFWDIAIMTVKEAMASWKGEAVKAAMEEEICSLIGMGTWELVEHRRGVNIMKNRWVLTTKYRVDDTVEREKVRLVVKGFTQVCGADYNERYSPVSSYVTLRIFLSIVAVLNLNLMQLDMKNAFLQSKLDRVLYMYHPDYFDDGTGRVCKVLKSLYGLKHSLLLWYRALDGVLLGAGWKKSQVNEALYFKASDDGLSSWVLVYVDDLLAASSSPAMLKELKELLEAAFELREISPVVKYLGLEIVHDRPARKLWPHQQGYADKLHRRFIDEEQGSRVPKTPVSVDSYAELTFDDEEVQEREEEYRQKFGSLSDIAFACSKLGSGLMVRSDQHWREVDRCLAYLADTRDTALEFGGGPESLELIGYVDVDDAGDKQNRTSTGGYVFAYEGPTISWSSSRIKCATLSSTESEYVAATDAGKEGRRLRFLLAEFKLVDAGKPTILRVDNKSAITVAEGLGLTGNLKHME